MRRVGVSSIKFFLSKEDLCQADHILFPCKRTSSMVHLFSLFGVLLMCILVFFLDKAKCIVMVHLFSYFGVSRTCILVGSCKSCGFQLVIVLVHLYIVISLWLVCCWYTSYGHTLHPFSETLLLVYVYYFTFILMQLPVPIKGYLALTRSRKEQCQKDLLGVVQISGSWLLSGCLFFLVLSSFLLAC